MLYMHLWYKLVSSGINTISIHQFLLCLSVQYTARSVLPSPMLTAHSLDVRFQMPILDE